MMMWAHHNQHHHSDEVDRAGHEMCPMTEAYRLHTGLDPWRPPLGSNSRQAGEADNSGASQLAATGKPADAHRVRIFSAGRATIGLEAP